MTKYLPKRIPFYLMEAIGLGIFMASACFFAGIMGDPNGLMQHYLPEKMVRDLVNALMMGGTALFIFYSPFTAPSGSHINPAVTLSQLRMGDIEKPDAFFYILFQFIGGTLTVYLMGWMMGPVLTSPPIKFAVTIPGKQGTLLAAVMEFIIAFIMRTVALFTSAHIGLQKYTRIISAMLVSLFVLVAGPVSGFGMNPARSFASALPAHEWTAFWVYLIIPLAGMLTATELYLIITGLPPGNKSKLSSHT